MISDSIRRFVPVEMERRLARGVGMLERDPILMNHQRYEVCVHSW